MTTTELTVKGMTCGGCERTLEAALTRLDGVGRAKADRRAARVIVHYDPNELDEQTLREQVALAGFEAA